MSLKYKLYLLILALAPEKIWNSRQFECGEHGRFEYCIDEIPGCVIGCYCYPGFYFDTVSKICEPNSNLLTRRSFSNPDRKTNQNHKESKQSDHITSADQASDLTEWLYKTFFSEIEEEAEKQAVANYPIKQSKNQKEKGNKVTKSKSNVANLNKNIKYFGATSAESKLLHGMRFPIKEIDSGKASHSDDDISSDEEIASDEDINSEESYSDEAIDENNRRSNTRDHGDHDHQHMLVIKRLRRKPSATQSVSPILPSFIFLPNMDTPFYPPLSLPLPPVLPMYPAVPVPPMAPSFPVPVQPIGAFDSKPVNLKDLCYQCHETTTAVTMVQVNKRKKKKRKHKIRPASTIEPPTETSVQSTTKTMLNTIEIDSTYSTGTSHESSTQITKLTPKTTVKLTTDTTIQSTTETKLNSTSESTSRSTSTSREQKNTTDTIFQPTELLNISIETIFTTDMSMITTEASISKSITVNNSYSHDTHRRGLNDYHEFLNSSKLFDRRKELKNRQLNSIRVKDGILKDGNFRDNPIIRNHNNSRDKSLIQNDIPLRALNLLQNILNYEINDKELPVTNNVDFKYLSDLIHRPKFNDNTNKKNSHLQDNIQGYKSSINDLENNYYSNLGWRIASLVRNAETGQGRLKKYYRDISISPRMTPFSNSEYLRNGNDLLFNLENKVIGTTPGLLRFQKDENTVSVKGGTRRDEDEKAQQNNMTTNADTVINNNNAYLPQENKNNIINIKRTENIDHKNKIRFNGDGINKIIFLGGSNNKKSVANSIAPYKPHLSNQVQNTNDRKQLQYRHQQSRPEGTKNGFLFNQNHIGFVTKTTRRPERSYFGRTFFSGDIM